MGQSGSAPVGEIPSNVNFVPLATNPGFEFKSQGYKDYFTHILQFYERGHRTSETWGSNYTVGDSYAIDDESLPLRVFSETHKECRIIETGNKGDCAINSCQATILLYYFIAMTGKLMAVDRFYTLDNAGNYHFNYPYFSTKGGGNKSSSYHLETLRQIRSAREIRRLLVNLVTTRDPGDPYYPRPYDWTNTREWLDDQALIHLGNIIHSSKYFNLTILDSTHGFLHRFPNREMYAYNVVYPDNSDRIANSSDLFNQLTRGVSLDGRGSILLFNDTETHFRPILPIPDFELPPPQKDVRRQPSFRDYFLIFLDCIVNGATHEAVQISPDLRSDIRNIVKEIERDRGIPLAKVTEKLSNRDEEFLEGRTFDDFDSVSRSLIAYRELLDAKAKAKIQDIEPYEITLKKALKTLVRAGHKDLLLNFDPELTSEIELLALTLYNLQSRYKDYGNDPAIMKLARLLHKIRKRFNLAQKEYFKVPVSMATQK